FSTTQGGMAVLCDPQVLAAVGDVRDSFLRDYDRRRTRSLAIQTLLYAVAVRPTTRAVAGSLYRWAQRAGLIRGSIAADEYGRAMPGDYLSRMTNLQATLGGGQLAAWERNQRHREQRTEFYLEWLETLGIDTS